MATFYLIKWHSVDEVLIKCLQPAKKLTTWRFEPSTFWRNRVK